MSFFNTLMKAIKEERDVKDNAQQYKEDAQKGMNLMFPVKINGKDKRPDNGVIYHCSIKIFDLSKDKPADAKKIADEVQFEMPNISDIEIGTSTVKSRRGYDVYSIDLHGDFSKKLKAIFEQFTGMGYNHEFRWHISVDKKLWDKIKEEKPKSAEEAGIEFLNPELRCGEHVISHYVCDELEKSFKNKVLGAITSGVLGMAAQHPAAQPHPSAPHIQKPKTSYSSQKMLHAIASVESSNGKNTHHKEISHGMNEGQRAYGKYGLTPSLIKDTIKMDPTLKHKYAKATALNGNHLSHFMQDNPGLEDKIATSHLKRLEHHFGQNPEKIGFGWLNGINGTYKAQKQKQDITNNWHVKKVRNAYDSQK